MLLRGVRFQLLLLMGLVRIKFGQRAYALLLLHDFGACRIVCTPLELAHQQEILIMISYLH